MMKPALKITTPNNTEAFFTSAYEKRSPLPSPAIVDLGAAENAYHTSTRSDRPLWRRIKSWTTGKGRSGLGRRALLVGLVGLIWLVIVIRDQPWLTRSRAAQYTGRILPGPSTHPRPIDIASDALPLEAGLRERLDMWRDAPGGRGDVLGEVEPGEFMQWNLEQCGPNIDHNLNTHMIQHSHHLWASQTRQSIHEHRMELIDHMEDVLARNMTEQYGSGRGIVMVAGNADTLKRVKWTLMMLRDYGCGLPVQVYHFPSEAPALDDPIREELAGLGAELVEAPGQQRDEGKSKSYHIKAISITDSPWQEVIYLDSDSIPLADPSILFDAPSYKRLGIWATPDYWKTPSNNPIWAIMGVKCRNEWEMESGQMVVDKKRHLDVMLLVRYMMEHHDFWFRFSDGDKDIFRFALLALRKRWGVPGRWVAPAGFPRRTPSGDFCGHTMLQHDAYGEPMFVHYNLLKQIPSGVGKSFSWGRSKQFPMFNDYPASPSTARLGGSVLDDGRGGSGDVDCDMLADADEHGIARAEAPEEVMRRAAREQGVKVVYHGGVTSALCINLEYMDPRPKIRQTEDRASFAAEESQRIEREKTWQSQVDKAQTAGLAGPVSPDEMNAGPVHPDWSQSPIELVHWRDHPRLKDFQEIIFSKGFKPNGKGF